VRISAHQRQQNETRIRAAMDRLLRGEIPPGNKCDITTLAHEADVDRTAFYGARPYTHLREEFETRLARIREAGEPADQRDAQINRLKDEVTKLKQRLADREQTIGELTDLKAKALSQLAAQHDEITRLRRHAEQSGRVRHLPTRSPMIGSCS
jgi:DNA repair exonuclease SbcCD ATPase subunit